MIPTSARRAAVDLAGLAIRSAASSRAASVRSHRCAASMLGVTGSVILVLSLVAVPALAGPHAHGVLIVHSTGLQYSDEVPDYCGLASLNLCENAVIRDDSGVPSVWSVYAAFPEGAVPDLRAVAFGIEYSPSVVLLAHGMCGDFEVPGQDWPASGEGVGMTWDVAQTDHLVEVYWFAGYAYYGPGWFAAADHPEGGGAFADDNVPSLVDYIEDFGILGFGQDGYLPCPGPVDVGACCYSGIGCVITPFDACWGEYHGGTCDPDPCNEPHGACCDEFGTCTLVYEDLCQGEWVGGPCDPNPCEPSPAEESTWGRIKSDHR